MDEEGPIHQEGEGVSGHLEVRRWDSEEVGRLFVPEERGVDERKLGEGGKMGVGVRVDEYKT